MAAAQGREIAQDEAVRHYFETVYRPQIEAMRCLHAAAAFPRRNETNRYLSIMHHRHRMAAKHGRDPGPEAAVVSFMGRFGTWSRRGRFKRRRGMRDCCWPGCSNSWTHSATSSGTHGNPAARRPSSSRNSRRWPMMELGAGNG